MKSWQAAAASAALVLLWLAPAHGASYAFGLLPSETTSNETADVGDPEFRRYPSCGGQIVGAAHESCGTRTGGPVGGLW